MSSPVKTPCRKVSELERGAQSPAKKLVNAPPMPHHRSKKSRLKPGQIRCSTLSNSYVAAPAATPSRRGKARSRMRTKIGEERTQDMPTLLNDMPMMDDSFDQHAYFPDASRILQQRETVTSRNTQKKIAQWTRWRTEIIPALVNPFCDLMWKTHYLRDPVEVTVDSPGNCVCRPRRLTVLCLHFDCTWRMLLPTLS